MYSLPTTLAVLILALSDTISAQTAKASTYTDSSTGIDFLGYADGTGFQFGMALPQSPSTDLIAQIIAPLTDGGGWGGIDFGQSMVGKLMVVAWPNGDQVMISPRIATGYDLDNGGIVYTANPVTLTPIPKGTFVNETHISAMFICGACLNKDSFAATDSSSTFSYAYAKTAVADPADKDTILSDHTAKGEPYGPFSVTLASAESANYATWAAMTTSGSDGGSVANSTSSGAVTSATSSPAAPASTAASSSTGSGSSSSSSSSSSSQAGSSEDEAESASLGTGGIVMLTMVGMAYLLQAFNIC